MACSCVPSLLCVVAGKPEIEGRPLVRSALGPYPAAVAGDDAPDIGEPYAGAFEFLLPVEPLEDAEQPVHVGRIESGPVVPDEEGGSRAFARRGTHLDHGA